MNESEFQDAVIEYARIYGWRVAHFRPARTASGWRTAVAADGKGFPDLTMVRGTRLAVAELKGERGRVGPDQQAWLDALKAAGVETYIWRPSDWPAIEKVLGRG